MCRESGRVTDGLRMVYIHPLVECGNYFTINPTFEGNHMLYNSLVIDMMEPFSEKIILNIIVSCRRIGDAASYEDPLRDGRVNVSFRSRVSYPVVSLDLRSHLGRVAVVGEGSPGVDGRG